jgi:PhoH-like ATPase
MAKKLKVDTNTKIFVLDTSVILFDHQAINNFKEHDVAIPITVLEELDNFKKGNDTRNFEARQFIRFVDTLSVGNSLNKWIRISDDRDSKFMVVLNTENNLEKDASRVFGDRKADHMILNAALFLMKTHPDRKVIMVTKDINLRLKARALDIVAEDYETGKIKDVEGLYRGIARLEMEDSELIDFIHSK